MPDLTFSLLDAALWGKLFEIIALNIVLSGDNAVVIALACRALAPEQRAKGIALGAGVAVLLRVVFTVLIASLLNMPFLHIVGALLLVWIAVKLIIEDGESDENAVAASSKLWKAVQTVAIADIVMSLDNVLAIAAVAKDSIPLLVGGLIISIPLIVLGASLITSLLTRFPILVWAGAGLLGWVAGEMFETDPWLIGKLGEALAHQLEYPAAILGAVLVLGLGYFLKQRRQIRPSKTGTDRPMDFSSSAFWTSLLQIIWIDLLLSGDNAVVIALAVRSLPEKQRKVGILLGAGAAVGLRIIFAVVVTYLLAVPFLKVVGALLLFWIAIKLAKGEEEAHSDIEASDNLWKAVRTIAIADAVMSLDNVLAIAAAARGHFELFIFGLLLTIPLIVYGARLLSTVLERFPILIWLGAALLGWIAGEMLLGDLAVLQWLQANMPNWVVSVPVSDTNPIGLLPAKVPFYTAATLGALVVVVAGYLLKKKPVDQPG